MAVDVLWGDPTASEDQLGMQVNSQRDPNSQNKIMAFGPDIVDKFLKQNSISMLIRSHQNPIDAIEKFASNQVVTLTSTSNYGGTNANDACMLVVQKKLVISPKIIKPLANNS